MTARGRGRALRWALRCHPAAYRAEHGAELAAIHAQATREAGRLDRLREALDVAGLGLRQRTGLGSDRAAGRVLAQAAPPAVALAAGSSVANLMWLVAPGVRTVQPTAAPNVLLLAAQVLVPLLWLAVLAAVWTGRWSAGRTLTVPATLLWLAEVPLFLLVRPGGHGTATGTVLNLAVPLLTAAVVLAAPRDLLGASRQQRTAVTGVAALALALRGLQLLGVSHPLPGGPRGVQTLWAAALAVALLRSGRGRPAAAGLAVAVVPLALQATVLLLDPLSPAGAVAVLLVLLGAAGALLRVRRPRPAAG